MAAVDKNGDGAVSVPEFVQAVRGPISPLRSRLILLAFKTLDADGNGELRLDDFRKDYGNQV